MTQEKLFKLGEKLYNEYRHADNYSINDDFFEGLSHDEERQVMNGFISQRKTVETDVDEQDHIETYWAMIDELT